MGSCCDNDDSLDALHERQRGTLQIVLGINLVMFFVIAAAAIYSYSSALLADSLDNLGDALTYGLSLVVLLLRSSIRVVSSAHKELRAAT